MAAISDFDALLSGPVEACVKNLAASGHAAGEKVAEIVKKAFEEQKEFLKKAVAMKKPGEEELGKMLAPTSAQMEAMGELHDAQKDKSDAKFCQVYQEGLQILAWVTVDKTPVPFGNETISSTMFYGNKVMMEAKGKNDAVVDCIKEFKALLEELVAYVKANHTTGVAWGSTSGEAQEEAGDSAPAGGNSVQAYDEFLQSVPPLVKASEALSSELGTAAAALEAAFSTQRGFLAEVENHSRPKSDEAFMACLGPQIEAMEAVSAATRKIKNRDFDLHGKALEEGAQLIAWVSVPTTVPHVAEQGNQVSFYGNKILMANKGDEAQKAWTAKFKELCEALTTYVKAEHKAGLAWKAGAPELDAGVVPKKAEEKAATKVTVSADSEQSKLFDEISKGTDISKGLKKVSDAEKTHKNRTGEAKPIDVEALEKKKAANAKAAAKRAGFPTGTAKTELEGKKWVVEYHVGSRMEMEKLEIEADKTHSVYIYGCQNTYVKVMGKVNAITIDKCKKTQVSFESCIGALEMTSCEGCEVQVSDMLRSVSIDKSSEVMVYLSRASMEAEFTTSACTCVNITVPGKTDDDDTIELNIPEQFVSHITNNKITTVPMDHAG